MKYGWRLLFIPLWAMCIAGAFLTAFLAAGWIGWQSFAIAAGIGLLLGVPGGLWNTYKVRRDDPGWS